MNAEAYVSGAIGVAPRRGSLYRLLDQIDLRANQLGALIILAMLSPVMLAIAFFFACVFDLGVAKFGRTFRTIFFIPFAVPAVVGAVMWSFLLEPQFGPMVHLANAFGFSGTNFFSPSLILLAPLTWLPQSFTSSTLPVLSRAYIIIATKARSAGTTLLSPSTSSSAVAAL